MFEFLTEKIWNIWVLGGWTMIPLFCLAIMIYTTATKMLIYFKQRDYHKVSESTWQGWVSNPQRGQGEVGEIIRYTQDQVRSIKEVHNRFTEILASKMPDIDRRISYLNTLVSAAPLLGLLGTVTGMLITFQSIGMGGGEMTDMMAKGISSALFPPEVGLSIALPGLMMVQILKRKRVEYEAFLAKVESVTIQHLRHSNEDQTTFFYHSAPNQDESFAPIHPAAVPA